MSVINIFQAKSKPGDRFEILIRPHIEMLYRFAYRLSQSQNNAEELVQQLLTKLYPKINQLESIEKLRPWLSRALYNLYIDTYRKNQTEAGIFTSDNVSEETATTDITPDVHIDNEETKKLLKTAIEQLSHDHRIIVMLHDAEGYTLSELEDILQTPIGTLKSRLNRARNHLKKILPVEPFADEQRVKSMKEKIS